MAGAVVHPGRRAEILREMGIEAWTLRRPLAGAGSAGPPRLRAAAPPFPLQEWEALRARVGGCQACNLHRSRTQTVFGVGSTRPRWVIVGEAPGAEEDRRGEPFVGAAGQLLNEMLQAVGLTRADVFIANILKCRPPDNRDPSPTEIGACAGHLEAQLRMLSPPLILAAGRIAATSLLQQDVPVGRLRGRVHAYGPLGVPLVVTYHPAYLLRTPADKRKVWDDLRLARSLVAAVPA